MTHEQKIEEFLISLQITTIFAVLLIACCWLFLVQADGKSRWQRWKPYLSAWFRSRFIMSPPSDEDDDEEDVALDVASPPSVALSRIAMPNNAGNAPLPDNEMLIFTIRVEALAALVKAGKIPLAEGIELVFGCSRSSRPESVYVRARAAIKELTEPAPKFPPLSEDQKLLREELGLEGPAK